jgi:hypothetical protein
LRLEQTNRGRAGQPNPEGCIAAERAALGIGKLL